MSCLLVINSHFCMVQSSDHTAGSRESPRYIGGGGGGGGGAVPVPLFP